MEISRNFFLYIPTHTNSSLVKIQTQKGSKERLVIMTRTHNMQILGGILFVKPQNDTLTTVKNDEKW